MVFSFREFNSLNWTVCCLASFLISLQKQRATSREISLIRDVILFEENSVITDKLSVAYSVLDSLESSNKIKSFFHFF